MSFVLKYVLLYCSAVTFMYSLLVSGGVEGQVEIYLGQNDSSGEPDITEPGFGFWDIRWNTFYPYENIDVDETIFGYLYNPTVNGNCSQISPPTNPLNDSWLAFIPGYSTCPLESFILLQNTSCKLLLTFDYDDKDRTVDRDDKDTGLPIVILSEQNGQDFSNNFGRDVAVKRTESVRFHYRFVVTVIALSSIFPFSIFLLVLLAVMFKCIQWVEDDQPSNTEEQTPRSRERQDLGNEETNPHRQQEHRQDRVTTNTTGAETQQSGQSGSTRQASRQAEDRRPNNTRQNGTRVVNTIGTANQHSGQTGSARQAPRQGEARRLRNTRPRRDTRTANARAADGQQVSHSSSRQERRQTEDGLPNTIQRDNETQNPRQLEESVEVARHHEARRQLNDETPPPLPPKQEKIYMNVRSQPSLDGTRHFWPGVDIATSCLICLEEFVAGEAVRVMSCDPDHIFHPHCISGWFRGKQVHTCPTCRKHVN